jgi:tRNA-specific 2-thiouridylase
MRVKAKIRHRHEGADAEVRMDSDKALVTFDDPQRAITPGQAVVFYDEDVVVGGGWIC